MARVFDGIQKCKLFCIFILFTFLVPASTEAIQNHYLISNYETNSILFDEEQFADLPDLDLYGEWNNFKGTPIYAHVDEGYFYTVCSSSLIINPYYFISKYDYSDKSNMVFLGSDTIPGFLLNFEIIEDIVYVNDYHNSLRIYNISNINEIQLIYESPIVANQHDIVVKNNFAYLGTHIFNITDLYNPQLVSILPGFYISDYYIVDDYLVDMGEWGALQFYNISNPLDVTLIVNYTLPASNHAAATLYTAHEGFLAVKFENNISIYDTMDIESMTFVSNTSKSFYINSTYMFIHEDSGSYSVYDIEDIYNPLYLANFQWDYSTKYKVFSNDYCLVIDWNNYIYSIDFSDLSNPVLIDSIDFGGKVDLVALTDEFAFVYTVKYHHYMLYIVSINDSDNIYLVNKRQYDDKIQDIKQKGDFVYILSETDLQIVDTSTTIPEFVGSYTDPITGKWYNSGSFIQDNYLFVVSENYGLTILDISNPINPSLVHNHPTIKGSQIQILNDHLFIDYYSKHYIYRLNSLNDIELLYTISDPEINFHGFCVTATTLYLHVGYNYNFTHTFGLQAYDITDLENPAFIEEFKFPNPFYPTDILLFENYLYIPLYYKGVLVFSTLEGTFAQVAKYNLTTECVGAAIYNGILCIAQRYEGITMLYTIPIVTEGVSVNFLWIYLPFIILIPLRRKKKSRNSP